MSNSAEASRHKTANGPAPRPEILPVRDVTIGGKKVYTVLSA